MSESHDTCIRCRSAEVSGPVALCSECAVQTKDECSDGMTRLGHYLAAWAAFEEWLRERGRTA